MKDNDYSYWTFSKIGISDIKSIHKKLFIKGFYSIATNEEVLSTYNIAEIKNIIANDTAYRETFYNCADGYVRGFLFYHEIV
jgi:hypothetical protein